MSHVTVDVIGLAPMDTGIWSANNDQPGTELFNSSVLCFVIYPLLPLLPERVPADRP